MIDFNTQLTEEEEDKVLTDFFNNLDTDTLLMLYFYSDIIKSI